VEALKKTFAVLDKVLEGRTFLVGNSVTLADVVMVCNLYQGMKNLFDANFRKPFPSLCRYYATVANQPQVVKVLGEFALCEKTMTLAGAPRCARGVACATALPLTLLWRPPLSQSLSLAAKKEEKPKAAAADKPKAAEKPKKAAAEEEDDDGEEPAEKPKKNPLDDLPKSKMIMDSWKRLYSNTPSAQFKSVCCAGLWGGANIPNSPTNEHFEGFDVEGYSIWFIEHMYPEEQTVQYKALNAVSGFFQRCDYARKHAFAVVSILQDKATNTFPIRGFFIFRGQDVNWQMKEECSDLEVYKLTKQDPNDPKVRARIEAFLCEDETIDGLANVEAKAFK
jgi:elongation factor 1-gamma